MRSLLAAIGSIMLLSSAATAQESAALIGKVYDNRTGEALAEAVVLVDGVRQDVKLSSQARFVLQELEPGRHRIDIRNIGYRPLSVELAFSAGQTREYTFELEFTGEQLPDILVEEKASKTLSRYADFERRRARGLGHFITRDEIRSRGYLNMGDALRTVKGVKVDCGPLECIIRMTRSGPRCFPAFWVDGQEARSFAVSTPISDVQGIEVYRGTGEIPGEFTGSTAGCGVVVIWTRAAP